MTQDEIIRMAREAGGFRGELPKGDAWMFFEDEYLEHFAALVAAHEREACAKAASSMILPDASNYPFHIVAAIRARGEK